MSLISISEIPYIEYFIILYLIVSIIVILSSTIILCMLCESLDKMECDNRHHAFETLNLQKKINTIIERERTTLSERLTSERLIEEAANNERNKIINDLSNYLALIKHE